MKKLFLFALLLLPVAAFSQTINTTVRGDARYTNAIIVSAKSCKLFAATSYNSSASTVYLQIFQTNAIPANGAIPSYSYPIPATSFLSFDFNLYGLDLDKCTVCISSTTPALTIQNNSASVQAIIRNN